MEVAAEANDHFGWFAKVPPQTAERPDRAHGGHSKAPHRHSNADVHSSMVIAAQMSAAGGKLTFGLGRES
jgi:hypothetical protein